MKITARAKRRISGTRAFLANASNIRKPPPRMAMGCAVVGPRPKKGNGTGAAAGFVDYRPRDHRQPKGDWKGSTSAQAPLGPFAILKMVLDSHFRPHPQ